MKITEIWRYPVKTMAGEKLQQVVERVHASDKSIIDRAKKLIEP